MFSFASLEISENGIELVCDIGLHTSCDIGLLLVCDLGMWHTYVPAVYLRIQCRVPVSIPLLIELAMCRGMKA
jgi:hypothetical protein